MSEIDPRRMLIRIGTSMVFAVGGPAMFAKAWGVEGVIQYILILSVTRFFFAEFTSWVTLQNPSLGLFAYRWSPSLLALGGFLQILVPQSALALQMLPVLLGVYLAAFWTIHHDISEIRGKGTSDYHKTEVFSTVIGTLLLIAVSYLYSIEIAVAFGGGISLFALRIPVKVTAEELGSSLERWNHQARARTNQQIKNGTNIARSVAAISFCSLSALRIHVFTDPVSIMGGIISLGAILAGAELVVWLITNRISYENQYLKIGGFIVTIFGFMLMTFGELGLFGVGFFLVTLVSRSVNRTADREFARSALRGLSLRPGLRERSKFRMSVLLTPLLWAPNTLPIFGAIAGVMLLRCKFCSPNSDSLEA